LGSHPIGDRLRGRGAVVDRLGNVQLAHHAEHLDLGEQEGALGRDALGRDHRVCQPP
jgi:hypothetical protein